LDQVNINNLITKFFFLLFFFISQYDKFDLFFLVVLIRNPDVGFSIL